MNGHRSPTFQLPAAEDDLWHLVVIRLLEQRDASEENARDQLRLLEELAFHYRFCGTSLTVEFAEDTAAWLAHMRGFGDARDKAHHWLRDLLGWELLSSRVNDRETLLDFPIPTLDEYFAARRLADLWRHRVPGRWWQGPDRLQCENPRCGSRHQWFKVLTDRGNHEVVLLMVGLLNSQSLEETLLSEIGTPSMTESGVRYERRALQYEILSRCRFRHSPAYLKLGDLSHDNWVHSVGSNQTQGAKELAAAVECLKTARLPSVIDDAYSYWIQGLRSSLPSQWIAASVLLSSTKDSRLVEPLVQELKTGKGRSHAAHILGSIGDVAAVESLLQALSDKSHEVRKAVLGALADLGDPRGKKPMIQALGDESPEVRAAAIEALSRFEAPDTKDAIVPLLTDANQRVRLTAGAVLGSWNDVRAVDAMIEGAFVPGITIRPEPIPFLLKHLGPARVVQISMERLRDPSKKVRGCAGEGLVKLPQSVDALQAALSDGDWRYRANAAVVLGRIGDKRSELPLLKLLQDENLQVRLSAIWALKDTGSSLSVKPLQDLLKSSVAQVTHTAVVVLGHLGDPRAVPALEQYRDSLWRINLLRRLAVDRVIEHLQGKGDSAAESRHLGRILLAVIVMFLLVMGLVIWFGGCWIALMLIVGVVVLGWFVLSTSPAFRDPGAIR